MKQSVKFAVSMPDDEFQELEKIRKIEGVSRSKLVLAAVKLWQETQEKNKALKVYRDGYRRVPETGPTLEGWEKAAAENFQEGKW